MDHVVQQGECLASIAAEHGVAAPKIWKHPANARLRVARKDAPNLLKPGDVLFVPDVDPIRALRPTGRKHPFRIIVEPTRIDLRFLFLGQPRKDEACRVFTESGPNAGTQMRTDGNGLVRIPVTPSDASCTVIFDEGCPVEERWRFLIGHLDPADSDTGRQARLKNLGFYNGAIDGSVGRASKAAATRFADALGLPPDENPLPRLGDVHGI